MFRLCSSFSVICNEADLPVEVLTELVRSIDHSYNINSLLTTIRIKLRTVEALAFDMLLATTEGGLCILTKK